MQQALRNCLPSPAKKHPNVATVDLIPEMPSPAKKDPNVATGDILSEIASHVQDKTTLGALARADKAAFDATKEARDKLKKNEELWPSSIFTGCLGSNATRSTEGVTPNGTRWAYFESNSKDLEDNDSTYKFTLGDLVVRNDDDNGRDFAQDKYTVSFKGKQIYVRSDTRARCQSYNKPMASKGEEAMLEALEVVAAAEGVTVQKLRAAIPICI